MKIVDHKLVGVPYDPARKIGNIIDPKFLVMHYTAGYNAASAINVFNTTEIAAHLVIDRNGAITQMVPFNRRANHAGPSKWAGVSMLNNHSIGFEFVNIGFAKKRADGKLVDAYGSVIKDDFAATFIPTGPNPRVGSAPLFWCPYTKEQIDVGIEITKAILGAYQIRDIVSHEQIDTRGWKTDPGPAFPMNMFRGMLRGVDQAPSPAGGMIGVVNTDVLNIRGGPGTNFPVIGKLKRSDSVAILGNHNGWFQIKTSFDKIEGSGFVLDDYVTVR